MSPRVQWKEGGEATIVSVAANAIVLRSTVPAAPGSRMEGVVVGVGARLALRVKVHASKRDGQRDEFALHGRPLDLTRELRERLEALVRDGQG